MSNSEAEETPPSSSKVKIYRYVAHGLRDRFEAQGWVFAGELPAPHCFYAVLYEWPGSEEELKEAEDAKLLLGSGDAQSRRSD